MSENGSFIKKKGFTITGNTLVRDMRLSLKARGLYLLIMSYITLDDLELTKTFLQKKCIEGAKAFNSTWDELKEMGYLKTHMRPGKKGWQSEYELLDEPQDGAHSFYHSSNGEISNTNLTIARTNSAPECKNQRTPQKGIYADGSNTEGIYANGGNNIILSCKTSNKILSKTQSIYQRESAGHDDSDLTDGLSEEELREKVEDDFFEKRAIPYDYHSDEQKMLVAVKILTDWYDLTPQHFDSDFEHVVFDMLVDCLSEMACADGIQTYKGSAISYAKIIEQINATISRDDSLYDFARLTVDDYMKAAEQDEIRDKRKYMKAVIWNSFSTYRVKFESDFARTFGNG